MLSSIALYYSLRKVQVNQDSLQLNGTYQVLVCVDGVNMLRGRVHTVNVQYLLVRRPDKK